MSKLLWIIILMNVAVTMAGAMFFKYASAAHSPVFNRRERVVRLDQMTVEEAMDLLNRGRKKGRVGAFHN